MFGMGFKHKKKNPNIDCQMGYEKNCGYRTANLEYSVFSSDA